MRLTIASMDSAAFDDMRAARDRGFFSVLMRDTIDEKVKAALTSLGFRVVEGRCGTFINWDRPRQVNLEGLPVNITAHFKKDPEMGADSFKELSGRARAEYKRGLAMANAGA